MKNEAEAQIIAKNIYDKDYKRYGLPIIKVAMDKLIKQIYRAKDE